MGLSGSPWYGIYKSETGKIYFPKDIGLSKNINYNELKLKIQVLHGDLAARNILLTNDNVVKICDFGLSKTIYKTAYYRKSSNIPLPVKWMAIESIRDLVFSTKSDVWSFGIVLWEFFSLAETPYTKILVTELHQKLTEGYRMERPKFASQEM